MPVGAGGLTVQVVIDGRSLESQWNERGDWNNSVSLTTWPGDGVSALTLWSSSFDPSTYDGELYDDGRVAVLTCSCGELGCGGVVARIEFVPDTVTWSDFRHASYLTTQGLGSFVFSRSRYEEALAAAAGEHHQLRRCSRPAEPSHRPVAGPGRARTGVAWADPGDRGGTDDAGPRSGQRPSSRSRMAAGRDRNGWWPVSNSTTVPALRANSRCRRGGVPLSCAQTR